MITVKKDAIKFKTPEGMQSVGVLANVGTFGIEIERYCTRIRILTLNVFNKSEVVLNLDNAATLDSFCAITVNLKDETLINNQVEHLTINCPNMVTTMQNFMVCNNYNIDKILKRLTLNIDTQSVTNFQNAFNNLQALETIDGYPLDLTSSGVNSAFGGCYMLKDIIFVEKSIYKNISFSNCPLLSDASIQSIIDGLADLTDSDTQTLTLHADVKAKLTEEQIATITSKNWTLA